VALAQWAARLYAEDFDAAEWQRLSLALAPLGALAPSPAVAFGRVAFPGLSTFQAA
jgi:hypothetical protein